MFKKLKQLFSKSKLDSLMKFDENLVKQPAKIKHQQMQPKKKPEA